MHVVVVGGGFGGMAGAARLAKLGHSVTLLDRAPTLGGALGQLTHEEFTFDTGPSTTLLPAVVRDLFRKSGRPLEREVELVPVEVIREHRFTDGTSLSLTGGSRAAQKHAFEALGAGLGSQWVAYVDELGEVWERVRKDYLERPWDPALAHRDAAALLKARTTLARTFRRAFGDDRLALVAGHPFTAEGHDLARVPAWLGTVSYVEQKFGAWTVEGGLGGLAAVLTKRLATRKVDVRTSTPVHDLVVSDGRVRAVRTDAGDVEADAVVCAVDPHHFPALRPLVRRTTSTSLPTLTHLGVAGELPAWVAAAGETVLHGRSGEPTLVLRHGGSAPDGHAVLTVQHRGPATGDVVELLARRGVDLRGRVVTRLERSPADLAEAWGGSPLGMQWRGRATVRRRLGPTTPVAGLYAAGAHATPGAGLPFTGLSGSLVAQAIGPA
ncbi:phytoene desaturase family protein [Nocardioides daphniae]|uniref:NAD(P)/FAD-dependent oxidoreductase n=1 Tax=Nocardioides daphniae TaxID=402297 RepID=A0A4P7UCE6_9ACTN|nr:NAD(P)/FAD-dependent oxidoreductase [Nocardioides daphniae]QCC77005.1 NAD(P)/FAD-dependent oxidoreductase [Nocardioides daphniae]GGD18586.1 phytoene desaturase [Nocardioides daphniae]